MFDPNAGGETPPPETPPAEGATPPAADPPAGDPPAADPNRPDYLLPKYDSVEAQAKGYNDLYGQFSKKTEDLKAELLPQIKDEWLKERGVPETPDAYKLPDGLEVANPDHGKAFMEMAHEMGVGQEGFEKLATLYSQATNIDPEAEKAKLGETADARIAAVSRYAAANVPKESYDKVAAVMRTAEGVEVIEALMKATRAPNVSPEAPVVPAPKMTREAIVEMKKDPRYSDARRRDAAYVKSVDDAVAALVAGR